MNVLVLEPPLWWQEYAHRVVVAGFTPLELAEAGIVLAIEETQRDIGERLWPSVKELYRVIREEFAWRGVGE